MTVIQKTIGRLPVNLGDYNSTRAYGKKNRVLLYGCEWESKVNNNTYAPAALNTTTGVITPDTTHWKLISGSYNTWLIDNGYQKMAASNVKDSNLNNTQDNINASIIGEIGSDSSANTIKGRIKSLENNVGSGGSVDQRITAAKNEVIGGATSGGDTLKKIEDRVSPLETAVGTGGSVDERIAAEGALHYLKSETYTKDEVNGMITTPDQGFVSVSATSETTAAADVLPATGEADTIYRVANWDGSQYDTSVYSEYSWNTSTNTYIKLSTKQVGIDDEPTAGSNNLVKSEGVWKDTVPLKKYDDYPENQGWVNIDSTIVYNYGTHKVVEVKGGDVLKFKSGTYAARVFLLKTYTKPTGNITPDFSDTTPNNIAPLANQTCTITIPSDTHYLAFACKITRTGEDDSPVELFINGIDIISGIVRQTGEISDIVKSSKYIEKLYNINIVQGWPDGSKVFVMNYGTHICLPVKEGDVVYNDGGNNYYLLNTYKLPSNVDNNPDFASGYDQAFVFSTNNESVLIPAGCNYIAIGIRGGNVTYSIDNLSINGVSIKERIIDIISNTIPLTQYSKLEAKNGWVDDSDKFVANYGTHKVISVKPKDVVRIVAGENSVGAFFLKTYTNPMTLPFTPDFSDAYNTYQLILHDTEKDYIVPDDTHYIAFTNKINSTGRNLSPIKLYVNGIDYTLGIFNQIGELGDGEYWKDSYYLNNIIQSKRRMNDVTRQNDSAQFRKHPPVLTFLHFSDVHKEQAQIERVLKMKEHFGSLIDDVIFTGDAVDDFSDDFSFWDNAGAEDIVFIAGNHEFRDTTPSLVYKSQLDVYNKFFAPNISNWNVESTSGKVYYYKDYPLVGTQIYELKGIRLIVIYPTLQHSSQEDYNTQLTWFANVLADARTEGYAVVIAQHFPFEENGLEIDCNFTAKNDLEWTDGGIYEDFVNAVKTFTDAGGEFITWMGGHIHRDEISKHSVTNQLCINIANASVEDNYSDYTRDYNGKNRDVVNVISFDIYTKLIKIIRIGVDKDFLMRDRNTICINYQTKEIMSQS